MNAIVSFLLISTGAIHNIRQEKGRVKMNTKTNRICLAHGVLRCPDCLEVMYLNEEIEKLNSLLIQAKPWVMDTFKYGNFQYKEELSEWFYQVDSQIKQYNELMGN